MARASNSRRFLSASGVELAGVNPNAPTHVGVVKAQKPVVWTENGKVTVR